MNIDQLLDAARLVLLRRRLQAQLARTAPHGLLSITLDLGAGDDDWLSSSFCRTHSSYWARPEYPGEQQGEYRLALGSALIFNTAGPARFSALQAAFAGLTPVWQHDDSDHTGAIPAAHIGFAFDEDAQDELPNARLIVPAILLQNHGGQRTATFSCVASDGGQAIERWQDELKAENPPCKARHKPAALLRKTAPLADRAFLARARAALADISAGKLEKIVLTRNARLEAEEPIDLASLLASLNRRYPECTVFAFGNKGQSFVGATPERLVSLNGRLVQADALAGTAWIGTAANSGQPGSLRLQDDKNSREQQLVVDAVRAALLPLCTALEPPQKPEIMQIRELQHLRTSVTGRARDGMGLFDLIERLHPTPAVGGTPRITAHQWLRTHGEQRAAWYTGGIGWIERSGDGEIVVPLRCARIAGTQAELFAGAGIVAGSDPAQELAETEAKFNAIIDALQHTVPLCGRTDGDAERTGTQ